MSNDCVPLKNVESPYGGRVSPLLGAAGGPPLVMFPVTPSLLAEGPQFGPWQVAVVQVDETPTGDSSGQDYPCVTQNRHRPMDIYELHDSLAHTVVEGGHVGPEVKDRSWVLGRLQSCRSMRPLQGILLVASMLGFTCQAVSSCPTFAPCS